MKKKHSASLRLCVRKTTTGMPGVRALARSLHRSPSHICRVLKGERKPSAELERKMKKLGLKPGAMAKEGK